MSWHRHAQALVFAASTVFSFATLLACQDDSDALPGPGLHLQLQVRNGSLQEGGLKKSGEGPEVTQVLRPQPQVRRGEGTVKLNGRLGPGGVALHLQAKGDPDHWVVQPAGFDFVIEDELLWETELSFSHAIMDDELELRLQAIDKQGRAGPVEQTRFTILPDSPPASLYISLGWHAPADLDLYVEGPDGVIVGPKNISSEEPELTPPDDTEMPPEGARYDFDSNRECNLDLTNRENVYWLDPEPPSGRYRVYVHLFSPCEVDAADFRVVVQRDGELTHEVVSTQYSYDAAIHPADGEAPGLRVLEFTLE